MNKAAIAGFTNLGYRLHASKFEDYQPEVAGKTVVVTGATGGIGRETAVTLSRLGARVVAVGRSAEKLGSLSAILDGSHRAIETDLSIMSDVEDLGVDLVRSERVDVLINNVGVLLPDHTVTSEGLEKSFATNVAGHFLLTNLLLPEMAQRGSGRVIEVSSGGMYGVKINPRRLQASKETYNGTQAYAQAKRAQVILTEMWSDALSGSGVTVNSMHPGWVNTPGVSTSLPTFNKVMKPLLRNVAQGADTIIWLAASEAGGSESGRFWFDRKSVSTHISPSTKESPELRTRMWETLAEATGSNPDFGQLTARR